MHALSFLFYFDYIPIAINEPAKFVGFGSDGGDVNLNAETFV